MDADLAARLQTAFNTRDIDAFGELLAEDAIWGDDPDASNTCHNRAEIIAHIKRLLNDGLKASILDTTTGPRGSAALLEIEWPDPTDARSDRVTFYQVYVVMNGRVTEIHHHVNHDSALAAISN